MAGNDRIPGWLVQSNPNLQGLHFFGPILRLAPATLGCLHSAGFRGTFFCVIQALHSSDPTSKLPLSYHSVIHMLHGYNCRHASPMLHPCFTHALTIDGSLPSRQRRGLRQHLRAGNRHSGLNIHRSSSAAFSKQGEVPTTMGQAWEVSLEG